MISLDAYLYELSNIFLIPVQLSVVALFLYACFSFGGFSVQILQRWQAKPNLRSMHHEHSILDLKGFSLFSYALQNPDVNREDLELTATKELDYLRITTRIAPMLGLVATMIPMGPALKALSNGNVQGISENLIIAFTAVIFSLLAAAITFWIASIKKQWLIEEICLIEAWQEKEQKAHHAQVKALNTNEKDSEFNTGANEVATHAA